MSVIERIKYIIMNEQISIRAFDASIDKGGGYTSSLLKRNGVPSADVIAQIHKVYPKYNLEWLLTGEGNWVKETHVTADAVSEPIVPYGKQTSITINLTEGAENSELFKALEVLLKKQAKK